MQRDGEFHHTQTRAEMATRYGHGIDCFLAQLSSKLHQIAVGDFAKICWCFHRIEKRRSAHLRLPFAEPIVLVMSQWRGPASGQSSHVSGAVRTSPPIGLGRLNPGISRHPWMSGQRILQALGAWIEGLGALGSAIWSDGELFHLGFGLLQQAVAVIAQGFAALVDSDGFFQLDVAPLKHKWAPGLVHFKKMHEEPRG